jgi:SAM-dependent methyltransferase
MPPARLYDLAYRLGAPWDIGPGRELLGLLEAGRLAMPDRSGTRAVDLGCGSGANVALLAHHGFRVLGIDHSVVALRKTRRRIARARLGDRAAVMKADLTDPSLARRVGTFSLIVDYGALNDQSGAGRRAVADNVKAMAHRGTQFVLWAWQAPRRSLPLLSLRGPSRLAPHLEPGEEERLFADSFAIERLAEPAPETQAACFLLTRR